MVNPPEGRVKYLAPILADAGSMRGEQRRSEKVCMHDERFLRSELVNGCGAIDYTEKGGTNNQAETLAQEGLSLPRVLYRD